MSSGFRLPAAVVASSGLYIVSLVLAPVAAPSMLLVPLPGLILATRGPSVECGLWFLLTAGAVMVGLGPSATPGFLLALGAPCLVLAIGVRRSWSFERTALAGIGAWVAGVLCLSLLAYGSASNLWAVAREHLTKSFDLALAASQSVGAADDTLAAIEAERDGVITALLEILPALVVLTGAVTVLVNLVLLRGWTGVFGNVNLRLWRTPDVLVWVLIGAGFGMFLPERHLALAARNLLLMLLGCYFCQGLAIVGYYLDRFGVPRGFRVACYVLIAVQQVVAVMVLALGVFDLWGNFRRLNAGPADVRVNPDGE